MSRLWELVAALVLGAGIASLAAGLVPSGPKRAPAPPSSAAPLAGGACRDWAVERTLYDGSGCPHPEQELSFEYDVTAWVKCGCRRSEKAWEATARAAIERLLASQHCDGDFGAGGAP